MSYISYFTKTKASWRLQILLTALIRFPGKLGHNIVRLQPLMLFISYKLTSKNIHIKLLTTLYIVIHLLALVGLTNMYPND